jgi:Lrp/AsnC family leucine-responsive transcriptional regulator
MENPEKLLDDTGWHILRELQQDARLSYAELGRRVGLSAPAVMERVKRLEETGIIAGYHVRINLEMIGVPLMAFVRVANAGDKEAMVEQLARSLPEVLECHHVLGQDCYVLKIAVPNVRDFERILGIFSRHAQTTTSLVLSSPVPQRCIEPEILGETPADAPGNGQANGTRRLW